MISKGFRFSVVFFHPKRNASVLEKGTAVSLFTLAPPQGLGASAVPSWIRDRRRRGPVWNVRRGSRLYGFNAPSLCSLLYRGEHFPLHCQVAPVQDEIHEPAHERRVDARAPAQQQA